MVICPRCKRPASELVPLIVTRLDAPAETTWSCITCHSAEVAQVFGRPAPTGPPVWFLRGLFERTWRGRKLRLEGRRLEADYEADPGPATLAAVLEWRERRRAAFQAYARAAQEPGA